MHGSVRASAAAGLRACACSPLAPPPRAAAPAAAASPAPGRARRPGDPPLVGRTHALRFAAAAVPGDDLAALLLERARSEAQAERQKVARLEEALRSERDASRDAAKRAQAAAAAERAQLQTALQSERAATLGVQAAGAAAVAAAERRGNERLMEERARGTAAMSQAAQQAREERQRLGAELDAERKRAALAETSLASALRGGGGAAPTGDLSSDASQASAELVGARAALHALMEELADERARREALEDQLLRLHQLAQSQEGTH